jgi:hypothetical protein
MKLIAQFLFLILISSRAFSQQKFTFLSSELKIEITLSKDKDSARQVIRITNFSFEPVKLSLNKYNAFSCYTTPTDSNYFNTSIGVLKPLMYPTPETIFTGLYTLEPQKILQYELTMPMKNQSNLFTNYSFHIDYVSGKATKDPITGKKYVKNMKSLYASFPIKY